MLSRSHKQIGCTLVMPPVSKVRAKSHGFGVKKEWHCEFRFIMTLTHWGRVTHICVGKTTIIGSDNGLSPGRRQAIIWKTAEILLIGRIGTDFSEILSEIYTLSFKKMHLKMSSAKWRPFCLGLNVLITEQLRRWSHRVLKANDYVKCLASQVLTSWFDAKPRIFTINAHIASIIS